MTPWISVSAFFPWLRGGDPFCFHSEEEARLDESLRTNGFRRATLSGGKLSNDTDLLEELGRTFDFPDWYGVNWNALRDSLSEFGLRDELIALVWTDADKLARRDLMGFTRSVRLLLEIIAELNAKSRSSRFQLVLFLVGEDESFRNSGDR